MKLALLAEDDERLAQLITDYLTSNGFQVVVEATGYNVTRKIADLKPNILILDVMLPGKDGLSICRDIRDEYEGPILMLTALDSPADQVKGLDYGADDYVTKPVEPRVLLARINALLRRYQPPEQKKQRCEYEFGDLAMNTHDRVVTLAGKEVSLSTHEFDMLLELAKKAGEIVSREYLYTVIYGREYDGLDRTVDVRISHLRKKLGDQSQSPTKIKTIWGKGYLFVENAWHKS